MTGRRPRNVQGALVLFAIALGLASRSSLAAALPAFLRDYSGDTLWALTLYLALGFVLPAASGLRLAGLTIVISFGVELSQLCQAAWINALRDTRVGGLILGFGFKWTDLVCYSVGALAGLGGEQLAKRCLKCEASGRTPGRSGP